MTASNEVSVVPFWDWTDLPEDEYRQRWRELAEWVGWLQQVYGNWVDLPSCWPMHECLRGELVFFWNWHTLIYASDDPSDGVRWHHDLRSSAEAWRPLSLCEHAEPVRYQQKLEEDKARRFNAFLEQALSAR